MYGNCAEFMEALRLIRQFFPEAKATLQSHTGVDFYAFLQAMQYTSLKQDSSCNVFRHSIEPVGQWANLGGFAGTDAEIYARLLAYTGFKPQGRVVVVPDALNTRTVSRENNLPFVCRAQTLSMRLSEVSSNTIFGNAHESLLVYESGEAIAIDHDDRLFWAKSKT